MKFVDPSGLTLLSEIEQVIMGANELLLLYPNPTSRFITLEISSADRKPVQMSIRSIDGRTVENRPVGPDVIRQEIDLQEFPSGIYFLQIMFDNGEVETLRFVMKKL